MLFRKAGHWKLVSSISLIPTWFPSSVPAKNWGFLEPVFCFPLFFNDFNKWNKGQNTSMTPTWTLASWNERIIWSIILLFITNFWHILIKEHASFKKLQKRLNETAQKIKTLCTLLTVVCFRRGARRGTRHPLNTFSRCIELLRNVLNTPYNFVTLI